MRTLKQGSKGSAVLKLQTSLKDLGFYSGPLDGRFGLGTKKAVIALQITNGLKPDGMAGPLTMKALQKVIANAAVDSGDVGSAKVDPGNVGPGTEPGSSDVGGPRPRLLTEADFVAAAELLYCDVAAIKAVAEVESAGNGFLTDGRVKILFEGHQFYKFCKGAYSQSYPTLCYKKWTKEFYTKGRTADIRGAGELARLDQAVGLDRPAALKAASYGKFQIMGFNFTACDFPNVEDFYAAMQISEGEQLKAFCAFIKTNKLDGHLRKHRWAEFARGYNGPGYAKNQYDKKLAAAHKKYSRT